MRRARRQTLDSITFAITLTGAELTHWQSAADRCGVTLEQLVRHAVERELGQVAAIVTSAPDISHF